MALSQERQRHTQMSICHYPNRTLSDAYRFMNVTFSRMESSKLASSSESPESAAREGASARKDRRRQMTSKIPHVRSDSRNVGCNEMREEEMLIDYATARG